MAVPRSIRLHKTDVIIRHSTYLNVSGQRTALLTKPINNAAGDLRHPGAARRQRSIVRGMAQANVLIVALGPKQLAAKTA
jgi:hypothetical protein